MAPVVDLDAPDPPPGLTRLRLAQIVDDPAAGEPESAPGETAPGAELAGLDALDTALPPGPSRLARLWSATWPLVTAVLLFTAGWQVVVWTGWKPAFLLPGPKAVGTQLWHDLGTPALWESVRNTMVRAVKGYAIALVVGAAIGIAAAQSRILRAAVSSILTGLQTMPTIAWLPAMVLLFKASETAMFAVVVLGASPSIASGVLTGIDHVPPTLKRAGRVLGARGINSYRHVILPGALPGFVNGLKQGWAFAWRSLMAAELIAPVAGTRSIGLRLENARSVIDTTGLYGTMIVILVLGIAIDVFVFARLDDLVRNRWGLADRTT